MDVQKEISLRNAISYCIENNDVNTATNRIMEFIRDEKEALSIADVSNCADELEPIIGNITATAFTTPNDHGIVTVELRYGHYKMKDWKKGDKLELKHCC